MELVDQLRETKGLPDGFQSVDSLPPEATYIAMRLDCGLSHISPRQAAVSVKNAWYAVCITTTQSNHDASEPTYVGMGRIISDGGWYFHIIDIAVRPEFQRRGIGDFIMSKLMARILEAAPQDEGFDPYVSLVADPPGQKLYKRWGFVETAPKSVAMERSFEKN